MSRHACHPRSVWVSVGSHAHHLMSVAAEPRAPAGLSNNVSRKPSILGTGDTLPDVSLEGNDEDRCAVDYETTY
jgi:hypothetical protein